MLQLSVPVLEDGVILPRRAGNEIAEKRKRRES